MFCVSPTRLFASAAGGDKMKVFFGLNRQYSLRDRRIKSGPPLPRKLPFHRIGVNPAGTKYFCRDFRNPTTSTSNASFSVEYRPFKDTDTMSKTKTALEQTLPGCHVALIPADSPDATFRIIRRGDDRVVFQRPSPPEGSISLEISDLQELVSNARKY